MRKDVNCLVVFAVTQPDSCHFGSVVLAFIGMNMSNPEKTTEELFLEMLEKDLEKQAVPIPESLLERMDKLLEEYPVDLGEKLDDADEL